MKKGIISLILIYAIATLIQGVLTSQVAPNFLPDLCLIIVIFMSLKLPFRKGILIAAIFGFVSDILFTQSIGLNLGAYPIAFFVTKAVSMFFFAENAISRFLLVVMLCLVTRIYYAFAFAIVGFESNVKIYPLAILLSGAISPFLINKLETWTLKDET